MEVGIFQFRLLWRFGLNSILSPYSQSSSCNEKEKKHTKFVSELESETLFRVLVTDYISPCQDRDVWSICKLQDSFLPAPLSSAKPPCSGALNSSCVHVPPAPACLDAFWPCCDGKGCLRALRNFKRRYCEVLELCRFRELLLDIRSL